MTLKKTVAVILLLGLVLVSSGGGILLAAAGDPEVVGLTLAQAMDVAVKNNPQADLNRLQVQKAQVALDEAKSAAGTMEEIEEKVGSSFSTAQARYVAPRAAEMGLKVAQAGAAFQEKLIKFTVESGYYELLKAEANLANANASLDRAREQLRLATAGYEAGTLARTEVMGAQVAVAAVEAERSVAASNREVAVMRLNKALGYDLREKIQVTDQFAFQPAEIDLEKTLTAIRESDPQLLAAREQVSVKEVNFAQAKKFYTLNVYSYRNAEYDLEEANVKLDIQERDLELSVRQAFLNLQAAGEAYRVLEQNVDVAKEILRVANLKMEAGVGTRIESQKAAEDLQKVEARMLAALYDYNLAGAMLRYGIFLSPIEY